MNKFVVIGGGISGLSCGFYSRDPTSISVFEQDFILGGRVCSLDFFSYTVDLGAQFLTPFDKQAMTLMECLDLKSKLIPLNMSFGIFDKDKVFPSSISSLLKYTSGRDKIELAKLIPKIKSNRSEFIKIPPEDTQSEYTSQSFKDWYTENVGERMLWLFDSIIRSISFVDSSRLSALYGLTIVDALMAECYSFKDGLSKIIEEIIQQTNLNIKTSTKVEKIEDSGNGFLVNGERYDKVVSSVPLPELKKIFPIIQFDVEYSSCHYVVVGFKKRLLDKDWMLFMPSESPISFVSEETLKFSKTKSNKGVMSFIIPSKNELNDQEILKIILDELGKIFDVAEEDIIEFKNFFWEYALPVCSPEFHRTLNMLKKTDYGDLILCGDYMSLPSLDGAIESGRLAAKKLL